jgi:transposase
MRFRDPFQTGHQEYGMTTTINPTERLTLTAAERQIILEEYDSYPRGDPRRGALLRRYGLYTSQMAKWRERLKRGDGTLASARPGPQPVPRNPLADEVARLTRENTRLHQQLTNAETIIAIQKKVATLLDLLPIPRADEAS